MRGSCIRRAAGVLVTTAPAAARPAGWLTAMWPGAGEAPGHKALARSQSVRSGPRGRICGRGASRVPERLAHGKDDPPGYAVAHPGGRGVPGAQRGQDAHVATDLDDVRVGREVPDEQNDLGRLQGQEHR